MVSSAIFCGGVFALSTDLLLAAQSWERRFLRNVFWMRHSGDEAAQVEGHAMYLARTAAQIDDTLRTVHHRTLVHELLIAYFREAWRDRNGRNRTEAAGRYRDACFWESVKGIPFHVRKTFGWVHGRPGTRTRQWEALMVSTIGVNWRRYRDTFSDRRAWMTEAFAWIDAICASCGRWLYHSAHHKPTSPIVRLSCLASKACQPQSASILPVWACTFHCGFPSVAASCLWSFHSETGDSRPL